MPLSVEIPKILQQHGIEKLQQCRNSALVKEVLSHCSEFFLQEAETVLVFSDFIANVCLRYPEILADLIISGDIERSYSADEYQQKLDKSLSEVTDVVDMAGLKRYLRLFRQREMMRIAWRDLSGRAGLDETMNNITQTAETCIARSLDILRRWHLPSGADLMCEADPVELVVVGMGKLGARELNFSSDVDLIFAYSESKVDNKRYEINVERYVSTICRDLIRVIGEMTAEGFVFRVDMGLRPDGKNGPLTMSFDLMEQYYQIHGREWERYAWIKSRIIAGNRRAGETLLSILNPFVYRRYLDFGVFEALREMKQLLMQEMRRKDMQHDIKLGPGGIREIEFFGQVFQLIRGGITPELQEPSIQKVLRLLALEKTITHDSLDMMLSAYRFLRLTENRLQMFADIQTHRLPVDPEAQLRLAVSLGFNSWHDFWRVYTRHTRQVHDLFSSLLEPEQQTASAKKQTDPLAYIWDNISDKEACIEILLNAGFNAAESVLTALTGLKDETVVRKTGAEARRRMDKLVPQLLKAALNCQNPEAAITRMINLLVTLRRRPNYLSLLLENPAALSHLANFADTSSLIMKFLCQHPLLLDELLDPRSLYYPLERAELEALLKKRLSRCAADDLEERMEVLRVLKRGSVLRVAAADATNSIPLMRVSDFLTDIAEIILREVMTISWESLVQKHGRPSCCIEPLDQGTSSEPDSQLQCGFAVIAYGKLGGIELGYDSDLDLVFLHAGDNEDTEQYQREITNAQFFARLGQRVLHVLSAHTATGKLYEADMRLRPSGSAGLLVSHINTFEQYQLNKAWTWETQALVRARPIYGEPFLTERFQQIRQQVLMQPRHDLILKNDIRQMRKRMQLERKKQHISGFDLKNDPGGIIDIEFIVQYLVLRYARRFPELTDWTDNVRLIRTLEKVGVINDYIAYWLRKAYLTYRAMVHRLSLREQPAVIHNNQFIQQQQCIQKIWQHYLSD